MCVEEILSFDQYWNDPRFVRKRPNFQSSLKMAYGDNIYHRRADRSWQQADSRHSNDDGSPNPGHVARDTKADRVLTSRDFVYYGSAAPLIPERFRDSSGMPLVHGAPSYRVKFPPAVRDDVIQWIRSEPESGLLGDPYGWGRP